MSEARDKFVSLAEARTTKVIKMIRLIGNLSNKSNYSYSEKDVAKIFSELDKELKLARRRFDESRSFSKVAKFILDSD